jgi:hypothetical protein
MASNQSEVKFKHMMMLHILIYTRLLLWLSRDPKPGPTDQCRGRLSAGADHSDCRLQTCITKKKKVTLPK